MPKAKKSTKPAPPPRVTALMTCEQCKKPFYRRRKTQRFCSRKCRNFFSYVTRRGPLSVVTRDVEIMVEARRLVGIIRERMKAEDPTSWSKDTWRFIITLFDTVEGK